METGGLEPARACRLPLADMRSDGGLQLQQRRIDDLSLPPTSGFPSLPSRARSLSRAYCSSWWVRRTRTKLVSVLAPLVHSPAPSATDTAHAAPAGPRRSSRVNFGLPPWNLYYLCNKLKKTKNLRFLPPNFGFKHQILQPRFPCVSLQTCELVNLQWAGSCRAHACTLCARR